MARLDYDDNAFVYFAVGILTSFLLPMSIGFVLSLLRQFSGDEKDMKEARTAMEIKKLEKIKKDRKLMTKGNLVRGGLLLGGWVIVWILYLSSGSQEIIQYDPWEILGLDRETLLAMDESKSKRAVKKAYRIKALEYHPDQCVGKNKEQQEECNRMFDKIRVANEILTDEEAYNLYMKTGSPDGQQNEISIGLPAMLLRKQNHNLVLVIYLILLVVVLPSTVAMYYSNSQLYGDKLILNDSYNIFTLLLNEKNVKVKHFPEVLALSAEFRKLPDREQNELDSLDKLKKKLKDQTRMAIPIGKIAQFKMFDRWKSCSRANTLIHVYLNRMVDKLSPGLKEDLDIILKKQNVLVEAMLDTVKLGRDFKTVRESISFEQHIAQALYFGDSSLLQLPHMTNEIVAAASSGKGSYRTISEFMNAPELERCNGRKKGLENLTESQVKDIEEATKFLPQIKFDVTIGVVSNEHSDGTLEFEESCCEGDIMTAYLKLERDHIVGPVLAPYLPVSKEEEWHVIFTPKNQERVLAITSLKGNQQVLREKIQFPSKNFIKPGTHFFDFHIFSNSYIGYDHKVTASVKLLPENSVKLPEIHPEDLELDKEPTLFEEAFGKTEESDDSDFMDSDDERELQQRRVTQKKTTENLAIDDDDEEDEEPKKDK